jgi:iron(III) transport system substrate-binding protein
MTTIDRRHFLKLAGAAGIYGLPALAPLARAADAAMMEKAKQQGKAVFYANITSVQPIMDAFQKATGIKGEYTRASSTKFVPTILTEASAGKLLADVLQSPQPMLEVLKEQGVLASYKSPSTQGYPDWATKDDSITLFGIEYVSYLFNTDHLKKEEAPARYEDLADQKWKNQIVMANPSNHPSTIAWLVGLKEQVDWGPRSGQPLLGTSRAIALTAKAPHPDAARAFMDYWLGKEAMGLLARDVGEYVLAPGVFPEIEGIDKVEVKPVRDLSDQELQKWGREFGKLFNTR